MDAKSSTVAESLTEAKEAVPEVKEIVAEIVASSMEAVKTSAEVVASRMEAVKTSAEDAKTTSAQLPEELAAARKEAAAAVQQVGELQAEMARMKEDMENLKKDMVALQVRGEPKTEEPAETKEDADSGISSGVTGFFAAYNADLPDLGPVEMVKVGKIMNKMMCAGYTPEKAECVCKALFCPVSEEDMKKAFDLFDEGGDGVLSAEEFTKMMPLLGEEMPEEKVAETMKKVDKDNSGKLEFNEFALLLNLLNPKQGPPIVAKGDQVRVLGGVCFKKGTKVFYEEGDIGDVVKTFPWGDDVTLEIKWQRSGQVTSTKNSQLKGKFERVKQPGEGEAKGDAKKEPAKAEESAKEEPAKEEAAGSSWLGDNVDGFMSAYNSDLPGLGPGEMLKVGKIMKKMMASGYTPQKVQCVCKALFCEASEEDMKNAFELFDEGGDGVLSAAEFTTMMPLLGEEMSDEKIAETLKKVDKDNSGKLEFNEFSLLINLLNAKLGPPTISKGDKVRVLGGVSFKKGAKELYREGDIGDVVKTFPWGDDVTLEIKWQRSGQVTSTKNSQLKGKFEKVKEADA